MAGTAYRVEGDKYGKCGAGKDGGERAKNFVHYVITGTTGKASGNAKSNTWMRSQCHGLMEGND